MRLISLTVVPAQAPADGNASVDWSGSDAPMRAAPPVSLEESEQAIQLSVAVPGLRPLSLRIHADSNQVLVEALVEQRQAIQGLGHEVMERTRKRLSRDFRMPEPIDTSSISATLCGCILTIRAQKLSAMLPADAFLP